MGRRNFSTANIVPSAPRDEGRHGLGRVALLLGLALAAMPLAPARAEEQSAAACGTPGAPAGPRIEVVVTGARKVAGNMTITLYGSRPEAFLARTGKLARQRVPVHGPETEACFGVSAPGDYAIAVYHDENDDHDFNRSILGRPEEGYGFSNDAPTTIGLPSFDAVRFPIGADGGRMTIRLRY
jgi:uncharacterized protein (DUF2141 family)